MNAEWMHCFPQTLALILFTFYTDELIINNIELSRTKDIEMYLGETIKIFSKTQDLQFGGTR